MKPKILYRRQRLVVTLERILNGKSLLDLNYFEKERTCGTYRCVLGWYRWWECGLHSDGLAFSAYELFCWAEDHFEMSHDDVWMIFGPRAINRPIELRLERAKELINES